MQRFPLKILAAAVFGLLAACSGNQSWQTTNITGILPDLEFRLTNENGETVTAEKFRGEPALVFFGYTHCPDICPITLGKLSAAIAQLPPKKQDNVNVLFVSVDPRRDSPQRLAEYTSSFGPQFIGLTGDKEYLKELLKQYRATFSYGEPDENGNYPVSHPSAVYVFDAQGDARLLMRYNDPVKAIASDLAQLIG